MGMELGFWGRVGCGEGPGAGGTRGWDRGRGRVGQGGRGGRMGQGGGTGARRTIHNSPTSMHISTVTN